MIGDLNAGASRRTKAISSPSGVSSQPEWVVRQFFNLLNQTTQDVIYWPSEEDHSVDRHGKLHSSKEGPPSGALLDNTES